jgi:membrane fusion protein (multidrug efflux system)
LVDVGNLVGEGEATILTDITSFNPIYVYFEVNELDLLRVMSKGREQASDSDPAGKKGTLPLELGLANEEGYPRVGVTDFADSQVDPNTGTLSVRGVLDNPGQKPALLPGLFTRVRIPIEKSPDMPLVTERAIGFDQSGQYLLVVNAENTVEKRHVSLGRIVDGLRVITSGVEAGDLVVVNGLQRAREGAEVEAEQIDMVTLTASAIEESAAAGEDLQDKDAMPSDELSQEGAAEADVKNETDQSDPAESDAAAAGETSAGVADSEPTQD